MGIYFKLASLEKSVLELNPVFPLGIIIKIGIVKC